MGNISKSYSLVLILILAASSLMIAGSVSAQSLKPAVTDFSLQYVDNSYDVPPSSKSTTDIYGQVTTTTIPGYHVENKSIVVTIKNPPGVDAYNFRLKAHDDNTWFYDPFDTETYRTPPLSVGDSAYDPGYASDSEYTVISLTVTPKSVTSVDVQVQALYGDYRAEHYAHVQPGIEGECYDFYFDGQASYWSSTQTITIGDASPSTQTQTPEPTQSSTLITPMPTPTPTAPDQTPNSPNTLVSPNVVAAGVIAIIALVVIAIIVVAMYRSRIPKAHPPPPPP